MGKKFKLGVWLLITIILGVGILPRTLATTMATAKSSVDLSFVSASGTNSVAVGKELTVNLTASNITSNPTGGTLTGIQGTISIGNSDCVSIKNVTAKNSASYGNNIIVYSDSNGVSSTTVFASIVLKANSNTCSTTLNLTEGRIAFSDRTRLTEQTTSLTINVVPDTSTPTVTKSNIATLNSLTPNKGTLSPSFNKNTTSYNLEVDSNVTNVSFTAVVTDTGKATVSGTSCNLSSATTTCRVVVTAEDGTTKKTYTVTVKKKAEENPTGPSQEDPGDDKPEDKPGTPVSTKSSDATLSSIIITDNDGTSYPLSPSFDPEEGTYTITVPNIVSTLHIVAPTTESHAEASIPSVTGLQVGTNVIRIPVKAEDGTTKIYTINVIKKDSENSSGGSTSKSSDNYIKDLIINDGELKPSFDKNISTYNITVPNEITSLNMKTILSDSSAKVNVEGNSDFNVCTKDNLYCNTVTIEVTAADGSIRIYTINVNRSDVTSKNKLDKLELSPGKLKPGFDPNVYEYEVSVDGDVDDINITAIPQDSNSKVEIYGNENLREGTNVVLIKVTDENGFVQYYRVNVNKDKKEEKADKKAGFLGLSVGQWLALLGVLTFFGLFILFLILFLKKKDKDEEDKAEASASPVIEFKPEINIGSRNNTDDDYVAEGAVLNQLDGKELPQKDQVKQIPEAEVKEVPYDMYDEIVTKDELFDAIQEATKTKDSSKLKMLYAQEMLNREKEKIKENDKNKEDK